MKTRTSLAKIFAFACVFSVACFLAEAHGDESLLNGDYIVNQFMDDDVTSDGYSKVARIEMTFDGNGNGSYTELESSTSGAGDSGDFTYTVDSDGTVSLFDEKGVVSSDGNIFSLSDTGTSDNDVHIMVGVKKGSGLSESTLNGTYILNGLMDDKVGTGGYNQVFSTEINFDGEGGASYETITNSTGAYDSGEDTYTVDSDGTLEAGAGTGIVSSDGNFWTLSDADTSDNAVQIMVSVKKGSGLSESTLNGTYFVNEFGVENEESVVSRLAITFDGNGNGEYITLSNSKGLNKSEPFQYNVESDGTLTIEDIGRTGVVDAAGEYFTLIDPDAFNQNNIRLSVGIKSRVDESDDEETDDEETEDENGSGDDNGGSSDSGCFVDTLKPGK